MGMLCGWCTALLHRHFGQIIKSIFLLFLVSFLWLQLRVDSIKPDFLSQKVKDAADAEVATFMANFSRYIAHHNATDTLPPVPELWSLVRRLNRRQEVRNVDRFGPLHPNDTVIVIQVHNRLQYLYALIESLKKMSGVNRTLLIFSHDLFDLQINQLVQQIDFCKVLQIYYPYSIQLYPHKFPGTDPKDCPRDIKKPAALKFGCNNAKFPDSYGHYREARFTQTKHHWWWKLNHIMDRVEMTRSHQGQFIFLEEDHYVAPDILHVLDLMVALQKKDCKHCEIMCMGTYAKTFNYVAFGRYVEHMKWHSSKHNMGMVISRPLWQKIRSCAKQFCSFDDYNWDWSLQYISSRCFKSPLVAMIAVAPRVFHIGECGVHHKGKDCSSSQVVKKVLRILNAASKHLFPSTLHLRQGFQRPMKPPKGNGGWGDERDHALCLNHVNVTVKF